MDDFIFKNEWSKAKGDAGKFVENISRGDLYKDYAGANKRLLQTYKYLDYTINAFMISANR